MPFTVNNLESAKFYRFTIGHAKAFEISRRELARDHWKIELSVR